MKKKQIKCECPEEAFVPPSQQYQYDEVEYDGMNHMPGQCNVNGKLKSIKEAKKFSIYVAVVVCWGIKRLVNYEKICP